LARCAASGATGSDVASSGGGAVSAQGLTAEKGFNTTAPLVCENDTESPKNLVLHETLREHSLYGMKFQAVVHFMT